MYLHDDPYAGVIDYDYLMLLQDCAIEEELRSDLSAAEENDDE